MRPDDLAEARRLMGLEFKTVRDTINNFDDKQFRTRGNAVTIAGAFLALAGLTHDSRLGLIAAASALFFFYIDIW